MASAPCFVSFRPDLPMAENLPPFAAAENPPFRALLAGAAEVLLLNDVAPWRYRALIRECRSWFPRLEAQFNYCGITRQAVLFQNVPVRHPGTSEIP